MSTATLMYESKRYAHHNVSIREMRRVEVPVPGDQDPPRVMLLQKLRRAPSLKTTRSDDLLVALQHRVDGNREVSVCCGEKLTYVLSRVDIQLYIVLSLARSPRSPHSPFSF